MHRMPLFDFVRISTMRRLILVATLLASLTGCDQLGIETPAQTAARQEAEGRAVGSACRHSGRALEDCYGMNKRASKAAVYAGWRDMDAYMRENKIEVVPSHIEDPALKAEKSGEETGPGTASAKSSKDEAPAKESKDTKEGKDSKEKGAGEKSAVKKT